MAKKNKNDDEAAGEPEVKLTAVTTLLPDPNDIKHNPNLLVETLRKAPAKNHPRARSDAALFLWDLALNDPDARARMCTEEFAGACQVALRDGDVVDRSATASLVREAAGWPEARPVLAAASGLVERLCDVLDDRYVAETHDASLHRTASSSKKQLSVSAGNAGGGSGGDADTASARAAAAEALRELTATYELRRTLLFPVGAARKEKEKGNKPPPHSRLRLDVLTRACSIEPDAEKRRAETPDAWRTRTACLVTLHQNMDPARNKDAKRARAEAFGDETSGGAMTKTKTVLKTFSEVLLDAEAPPEARRAAAWCLAHATHDEHRRDAVLADTNACLAMRRALRDSSLVDADGVCFATRAGVARAVANVAAVSSSAVEDDKEEDGISDDALNASDPRSLRLRARALEGRLGALRKIPKDELKPADAEERDACVSELKKLARVFAGELAGTLSDAERVAAQKAQRRAEEVLERTNPLGALCRLIAPPGENAGAAYEDEADDADAAVGGTRDEQKKRDAASSAETSASLASLAPSEPASAEVSESAEAKTQDESQTAETAGNPPSADEGAVEVSGGAVAEDASRAVPEGAVGAETPQTSQTSQTSNAPTSNAESQTNPSGRTSDVFAVGQAEAVAAAAAALRRLTVCPDARAFARLVSLDAPRRLLWHLTHSKDVATRRDCRETLRQLARDAAAKAAIEAEADAPALASRAFAKSDGPAGAAGDKDETKRMEALVPGLTVASARRRPKEEVRATRAKAYRARGTGVLEVRTTGDT
jgi:hypothetical protein